MNKKSDYINTYKKIVGEKEFTYEYNGPEEEAKRITLCSILEPTEIRYGNQIEFDKQMS